jgi:hypothetical protein
LCSYVGFVDVVQNATSRPASVDGSVLIRPNVVVASSLALGVQTPLIVASGNVTVLPGSSLLVSYSTSTNGVIELVKTGGGLIGQFASVVLTLPPGSTCVVSAPTYSSNALSVTLSLCTSDTLTYSGLTTPEIVGISIGVAAAAILIGVAIAMISKALIAKHTARMKVELKENHLAQLNQQEQHF